MLFTSCHCYKKYCIIIDPIHKLNNCMIEKKIIAWCRANNWTEPRQIENGLWVAFPPNGVIENIIPNQSLSSEKNKNFFALTWFFYAPLLLVCMVLIAFASICITPLFFLNIIKFESQKSIL